MKLTKISLIVVIVASLASGFFAMKLAGNRAKLRAEKADAEAAMADAQTQLANARNTANAVIAQNQQLQQAYGSLQQQFQAQQQDAAEKDAEIATMRLRLTRAEQDLQDARASASEQAEVFATLQVEFGDNILAAVTAMKNKIAALEAENELLGERLRAGIAPDAPVAIAMPGAPVPQARGRIVAIYRPWNFAVVALDGGEILPPKTELLVYRDAHLVGKLQVAEISSNNLIIADILPSRAREPLRVGDAVFN
jgi:hypothetical protein